MIADVMRKRTQRDWLDVLEQAGVPCGPINTIDQVFDDAQVRAREMQINLPHALGGSVPQVASPLRYSATPVTYERPPPLLGEHTAAVLREMLGYDDAALQRLAADGVIGLR
jgi:crotonobetainyl-CoA:carnitine CoA-transferase CaiB-like acyl-CoA transferase